jgi:hypothetical protein
MQVQRMWRVLPVVAIALTGLVCDTGEARAADLTRFISPDFCAAVVIHPERINESTLAETIRSSLPKEMAGGDLISLVKTTLAQNLRGLSTGADGQKIEKLLQGAKIHRIVFFTDSAMVENALGAAVIVQFGADMDGEGLIAATLPDRQNVEAGGVKYSKIKGRPGVPDMAAVAPDSRTLIVGVESTVVKMLGKNEGERPLLKQLQKATLNHDILIEVCAEPLWAGLAKGGMKQEQLLAGLPPDGGLGDMAKDIKSLSLRLDFSGDTLIHAEATTGKAETAAMMAKNGQDMLNVGKQQFEALKKAPPSIAPADLVPTASKLGDEALAGVKIKADGTTATLDVAMPPSLPEALKAAGKMVSPMIPAPAAAK